MDRAVPWRLGRGAWWAVLAVATDRLRLTRPAASSGLQRRAIIMFSTWIFLTLWDLHATARHLWHARTHQRRLMSSLRRRLALTTIYSTVLDRKVPKVNWWFTLGSASLFLFVMQGITGMLLTVYYVPSPDSAYDSIQYIMTGVQFGWLIVEAPSTTN